MSVADILGTKVIDAAGAIVPIALFYLVGKYGTFRRIRKAHSRSVRGRLRLIGSEAISIRSGEDDRRLWLANVAIISMGVGTFFASCALLGIPLT